MPASSSKDLPHDLQLYKRHAPYSSVLSWTCCKISISLINSAILDLQGTHSLPIIYLFLFLWTLTMHALAEFMVSVLNYIFII